ncbi:MAG: C-type lectin domain-containing protein [Myxococcales bacterium]|nr:C-type lectin domain-containing protein [Myxococcales bacterium]
MARLALVALLATLTGCDQVFDFENPAPTCPPTFMPIAGGSYLRNPNRLTWPDAEAACEALHNPGEGQIHLAVLSNEAEFTAIHASLGLECWLGHTDNETDSLFRPITKEPTPWPPSTAPPWLSGQPNNIGTQHCLWIDETGQLDNKDCMLDHYASVCECDSFAPVP